MSLSRIEIAAATFVLAGIAAMAWFLGRAAADEWPRGETYEVAARLSNAEGLKAGSPVLIAGVSVGSVESIALDDHFAAIVKLRVRRSLRLSSDTIASIQTSGLIGDQFLALAPGSRSGFIPPGGLIADARASLDLESPRLGWIERKFDGR